jgi:GT2 family glycosyltransferase
MTTLSVIILSYNTKQLLWQSLSALIRYIPKKNIEIIVLDNASSDDSAKMIKENFPDVNLVHSYKNLGFAKGINTAVKEAKGKYLLFLNSDADLTNNTLDEIISFMDSSSSVGVVGGVLLNADGSRQRSYGSFYTLSSATKMLIGGDKIEMKNKLYTQPTEVDWVSGGFMMINHELFKKIGGFDEHFFMYMEDMELCYRVRKAGYRTYVYPQAVAIHKQHGSTNRSFAVERIYEGLMYFYKKHRSPIEYYLLKSIMTIKALLLFTVGFFTRNRYLMHTYKNALVRIL